MSEGLVVTKRIDTISTSVQKTITSKLSSELSTKLNAELGLFPVPGSAKASGEIESKITAEFTTALANQLSTTMSCCGAVGAVAVLLALVLQPIAPSVSVIDKTNNSDPRFIFVLRFHCE